MHVQSVFVLDAREGDVLVEKHYAAVTPRAVVAWFLEEAEKAGGARALPAVLAAPKHYVFHLARADVVLVATAQQEVPPLMCSEFLSRVADVVSEYLGALDAASVRAHFVVVYQLLEEMMDSGMPFTTEVNVLKGLIAPPNLLAKLSSVVLGNSGVSASSELNAGVQSNVPWRKAGVKYAQNEVFLDVVESIDATLDSEGRLVAGGVYGEIRCQCRLSGMPDMQLALENVQLIEDCNFHPCVRLNRWNADRVLSFVPPDGNFKLGSYSVRPSGKLPLPMYVKPQLTFVKGQGRLNVLVGPRLDLGRPLEGIVVRVPLPSFVSSVDLSANVGQVVYDEHTKEITWSPKYIPKDKSPILTGKLLLQRDVLEKADGDGQMLLLDQSIALEASFRMQGVSASQVRVAALNMVNEKYKPNKGVRYLTQAGRFVIRT